MIGDKDHSIRSIMGVDQLSTGNMARQLGAPRPRQNTRLSTVDFILIGSVGFNRAVISLP